MAYDSLKNIIRQYIKTNGEQEITGQIMQNVLIEMVNNYPSTEGCIRATLSNLANGDILVYDSVGAWYNVPMSSFLAGYATQLWVNQQGYVTSSALAGYIHPTITDLANGDILIWDSVGAWVNAPLDTTISGFGYVKSTGSVAYATSAGSANILGHSVYENPAHALANGDMLVYDSGTGWTNVETSSILSGYATQSWVTSQGYITSSALNGYATQSWVTSQGYIQPTLSNLSNGDILIYDSVGAWVNTNLNTTISGFGYITSSALSGYATESWVNQQGFLTSSALNGYIHPTLTNLANGDILIYDSVGAWYNTPLDTTIAGFGYIKSSSLSGYLPLTGGTVTGAVNLATNSGNVGIGTSSPAYKLDVNGSFRAGLIEIPSSQNIINATTGYDLFLNLDNPSNVLFYGGGNVGIGTTNPAYKLDVNGILNATTIYQNGTAISSIYLAPNLSNLANGDILVYDTVGAWYNTSLSSFGFATQTWVGQQGYLTSSGSCAYATSAGSANILGHTVYENQAHSLANGDILVYDNGIGWTNVETSSILSGYATQSWVSTQLAGYLPLTGGTLTGNGIVLTLSNTNKGAIGLLFYRGNNTAWQIVDEGGNLYFTENTTNTTILRLDELYQGGEGYIRNNLIYHAGNLTNVSQLTNDSGYITSAALNGYIHPTLSNLSNGDVLIYDSVGAWVNASLDTTVAGFGYVKSTGSVAYATSAGSANILGHSVTLNSAHSLSNGDILVYDSVGSWTNVSSGFSDIRQKDVINYNAEPTFEAVANAPAIRFTYKDNTYSFRRGVHIGSIAQYWQTTLPETVSMDNDGILSMQYDVIALLSTISVAKKVSEHERRIVILERENEELRKELAALKSA